MSSLPRAVASPHRQAGNATHRPPGAGNLHALGVLCGLSAGVWLGAAEAPTKLVAAGFSPFTISLLMVAGVFTARWTVPTLLKGTGFVLRDLRAHPHLLVWAVLAGALWAVANTLTVFAIRDVGLAVAFPLWNTNSLIGLLWGRLLFRELEGASRATVAKVVSGAVLLVLAAVLLAFSTLHGGLGLGHRALPGVVAALAASLLWGTMYVPYRKAYLSGLNPLSFVTVFTVGELLTMLLLVWTLDGGANSAVWHWARIRPAIFWLFLGGFVWVVGDLFQQFAAKYLGIGRGIPLSNTNQLWGLAWGALVFGELRGASGPARALVLAGSALMILGTLLISTARATGRETLSRDQALERECLRYGLDPFVVRMAQVGGELDRSRRRWWDWLLIALATGVFLALARVAVLPPLPFNRTWVAVLGIVLLATLGGCGWRLWRVTRFT